MVAQGGSMSGPLVSLDFAPPRLRPTIAGGSLLLFGMVALVAAGFEYRSLDARRAGLEVKLSAALRQSRPDPNSEAYVIRANATAADVAAELATPWTALLADLELAARDSEGSVAILAVEPDHEKHRVRITGESREMSDVLAYLTRLEGGTTLQFPMLDSHEVVAGDKEHPIRFTLTADWAGTP
jgi:hypothetical protein